MTRYLPDDYIRCSAYWYAARAQMVPVPLAPGDLEFLCELGLRAALLARWEGIAPCPVPEGPFRVHQRPERIWSAAADAMAQHAAEHGDYGPLTRVVHCRREPYEVLIDRTTPWGNPFVIGRDGTRDQVIAAYEAYLRSRADLMARLGELRGRVLGCWCAPEPCHGDVLARLAEAIPPSGAFSRDPSCDRCNYDTHRCKGCGEPLPHGTEICADCDDARGGRAAYGQQAAPRDDFWSYPAPPEDTQAYVDWCAMAEDTQVYVDWCAMADEEGRVPAGFAYRELTDAEAAEAATWD